MAVVYCTLHRLGYNTDLDPACPQCVLARVAAPPAPVKELPKPEVAPEA